MKKSSELFSQLFEQLPWLLDTKGRPVDNTKPTETRVGMFDALPVISACRLISAAPRRMICLKLGHGQCIGIIELIQGGQVIVDDFQRPLTVPHDKDVITDDNAVLKVLQFIEQAMQLGAFTAIPPTVAG